MGVCFEKGESRKGRYYFLENWRYIDFRIRVKIIGHRKKIENIGSRFIRKILLFIVYFKIRPYNFRYSHMMRRFFIDHKRYIKDNHWKTILYS